MTQSCLRARPVAWLVFICLLVPMAAPGSALARAKPGPVNERGTAANVTSHSFTLQTATHGAFVVAVSADTSVTMAGKRSQLRDGDHVGVHGFLSQRRMRAIWVHIYSRAATKPFSISGVVISLSPGELSIRTSTGTRVIQLGARTPVVVGSRHGTVADLRLGDRVLVRVQGAGQRLSALHVHVYRSRTQQRHVEISGTVVAVAGSVVSVKTARGQVEVRVPAGTRIYFGSSAAAVGALHSGERVRVYACCEGAPLAATSIHIYRSRPRVVSRILHGTVQRVQAGALVISAGRKSLVVLTGRSTRYQIAAAPATLSGLHVGDEVTVWAHVIGGQLLAVRIDVPAASRAPRTISGVVVAVAGKRVVVSARGKRYTLDLSHLNSVVLGGTRVAPGSVRAGDTVRASGILRGNTMTVASMSATRPSAQVHTVRGTIVSVAGTTVLVVDSAGARHVVQLVHGARATAHGTPVPAAALFPGVRATARGTLKGSTLQATSFTITVEARDLSGRLTRVGSAQLSLLVRGRSVKIDLGGNPSVTDAGHRTTPSSLHVGAFIEARGYTSGSLPLRATSIRVLHPSLDITGTLSLGAAGPTVHTSTGETFRLRVGSGTQVSGGRVSVSITLDDVPAGTHVHVMGTVESDGSILVTTAVVHLASVTTAGTVGSVSSSGLSVVTAAGTLTVRAGTSAEIVQGSHVLRLADVVPGDTVTVEGYQGNGVVLLRKLLVHRPLVGLSGVVQAIGSDGLTLSGSVGVTHVLVGPETQVTGTVATGVTVHVTGYRRGDGVIVATRIRVGK